MAVTTDPFVAVDLAAMIPEVWSNIVEEEFFDPAIFTNFFLDLSPYLSAGGDYVHVPDVYTNAYTVSTQSTQGAEISTQGPAQVDITLNVATHKYVAQIVGDKDLVQLATKYNFNEIYARKMAGSLMDTLEGAMAALWSSLTTNTQGDTSDVLTDYDIRYAMEKVHVAVKQGNEFQKTAWLMDPFVWWMQIYGITKYYKANEAGNTSSLVLNGNFGPMDASRGLSGQLYGRPVYVSGNVVSALSTHRNIFAHPHALGFAVQTKGINRNGKIRVQAENAIRNLGMLTVSDIIYGVGAIREEVGCAVSANQTAVTS